MSDADELHIDLVGQFARARDVAGLRQQMQLNQDKKNQALILCRSQGPDSDEMANVCF